MAQRREAALGCVTSRLLGDLQSEEQRPRPTAAGNDARDLRKRTILLTTVENAALDNRDFMGDALPFPQQPRPGFDPDGRLRRPSPSRGDTVGRVTKPATRGR